MLSSSALVVALFGSVALAELDIESENPKVIKAEYAVRGMILNRAMEIEADLVQAFPLVSTAWGVLVLGEFRGASERVRRLLAAMYATYLLAVLLLILSVR